MRPETRHHAVRTETRLWAEEETAAVAARERRGPSPARLAFADGFAAGWAALPPVVPPQHQSRPATWRWAYDDGLRLCASGLGLQLACEACWNHARALASAAMQAQSWDTTQPVS